MEKKRAPEGQQMSWPQALFVGAVATILLVGLFTGLWFKVKGIDVLALLPPSRSELAAANAGQDRAIADLRQRVEERISESSGDQTALREEFEEFKNGVTSEIGKLRRDVDSHEKRLATQEEFARVLGERILRLRQELEEELDRPGPPQSGCISIHGLDPKGCEATISSLN